MLFVLRKYHCRLRSLCGASFGPRKHVCGGQIILWVPGVVESAIVLLNCDMDIMPNDRGVPWLPHVSGLTDVVVYAQLARSPFQAGGGFFVLGNVSSPWMRPDVGHHLGDRTGLSRLCVPGPTDVAVRIRPAMGLLCVESEPVIGVLSNALPPVLYFH